MVGLNSHQQQSRPIYIYYQNDVEIPLRGDNLMLDNSRVWCIRGRGLNLWLKCYGHVAGWTTAPVRFALLLVEAKAILEVWIRSSSNRRRSTLSLYDKSITETKYNKRIRSLKKWAHISYAHNVWYLRESIDCYMQARNSSYIMYYSNHCCCSFPPPQINDDRKIDSTARRLLTWVGVGWMKSNKASHIVFLCDI